MPIAATTWGSHHLTWGERTYIMGILNITPDSFSQDGLAPGGVATEDVVAEAVRRGLRMVDEGADMLDVGGESTRPATVGQPPLSPEVEAARVVPVIAALARALPPRIVLSVDTSRASVAAAALDAGATLVNDVWGLHADDELAPLVARHGVPVVLMSNLRGQPRHDPLGDVVRRLASSIERALAAGVAWERLILDPGFGFGLNGTENLRVLTRLGKVRGLGRPVLIGTSRKSHIGLVLGTGVEDRIEGTAATVALGISHGADIVRVHDVRAMARVARMSDAVVRGYKEDQV